MDKIQEFLFKKLKNREINDKDFVFLLFIYRNIEKKELVINNRHYGFQCSNAKIALELNISPTNVAHIKRKMQSLGFITNVSRKSAKKVKSCYAVTNERLAFDLGLYYSTHRKGVYVC